jgi:hypothetical protein
MSSFPRLIAEAPTATASRLKLARASFQFHLYTHYLLDNLEANRWLIVATLLTCHSTVRRRRLRALLRQCRCIRHSRLKQRLCLQAALSCCESQAKAPPQSYRYEQGASYA